TGSIGLIAANADEADAEIAHGALEELLAIGAQVSGSDVADEDGIVTLHFGEGRRESVDADQFQLKARGLERGRKLLVLLRIGRNDQDTGFAPNGSETGGAIVLGQRVAGSVHLHVVTVEV